MGSIFLFIIFIIFLFIFLGLSLLKSIFSFFFNSQNINGRQAFNGSNTKHTQNNHYSSNPNRDNRQHQKIFGKDEGEYVDFEEIEQNR